MLVPNFRLISKPVEQLTSQARPLTGLPEVVPWYFFHRRSYVAAGQTQLNFFDAVESDPGLSNMELAGQLPTPQFLEVYSFHFDILGSVSTSEADAAGDSAVGALRDILLIRRVGRGRWLFSLSNKDYGEFPLTGIGPVGNPTGFGWSTANTAVAAIDPESQQFGGWYAQFSSADPIITIPPTTGFRARTRWNAVQAISAATDVEFGLWGPLHRKVV